MRRLLIFLLLLVLAAPAQASFPGRNGDLVVSVDDGTCELGSNLHRVTPRGAMTRLTDACPGNDDESQLRYAGAPEAAPDGVSLLTLTNLVPSGVARLALDAGALTEVPADPRPSYDPTGFGARLSLFPDGTSFIAGKRRYAADGTSQALPFENARVSPDGKLLAVARGSGLWLHRVKTGRALRKVGPRKAVTFDWSPDGRRLVYATRYQQREIEGGAAGGNLFVVGRDGRNRRSLVQREDVAETEPTWSPDGRTVAFVSLGFSAGDVGFRVTPSLWKVSVRTGKRTRIRSLERPAVEEGYFHAPELTWLPRP